MKEIRVFKKLSKSYVYKINLAFLLFFILSSISFCQVIDLGTLGGETYATAINDSGQVVGYSRVGNDLHAFIWQEGSIQDLNIPVASLDGGQVSAQAFGISNSGQVIGNAGQYAFLWLNGITTILPPNTNRSGAYCINNFNQIVGEADTGPNNFYEAVYWQNGSFNSLGIIGNANANNDNGQILYYKWEDGSYWLWQNGNNIPIGTSSNVYYASDINNLAQVVGGSINGWFLWENGTLTAIPISGGATAINDSGDVVGGGPQGHPYLFRNGIAVDLNTLIDPSSGWVLNTAIGINNVGDVIGQGTLGGQERAYLINIGFKVTNPKPGDLWIAGTTDTIKWQGGPDTVDIYLDYEIAGGTGFLIPLVSNHKADPRSYVWKIPDTLLSKKCKILIEKNGGGEPFTISEKFRIKGYELTRPTTDNNYERFKRGTHDWNFSNIANNLWPQTWWNRFNYQTGIDPFTNMFYPQQFFFPFWNANSSVFPDWELFVRGFGTDFCYFNQTLGLYKISALMKWFSIRRVWGGSCSGMAISSLLAFDRPGEFLSAFPEMPGFLNLNQVQLTDNTRKVPNQLWFHWFGQQHQQYYLQVSATTPNQTINELKQIFSSEDTDNRYLYFVNNSTLKGAHAVTPYKVEHDTLNQQFYWIHLYDNSYPFTGITRIRVDTTGNGGSGSWISTTWTNWGGNRYLLLMDPSSTYLTNPTSPVSNTSINQRESQSNSLIEIFSSTSQNFFIKDQMGNTTGIIDSLVVNTIPDAVPNIPPTGSETPPYSYYLPTADYTIYSEFPVDSMVAIGVFTDSIIYNYIRTDALNNQKDILKLANGVTIKNNDPEPRTIIIQTLIPNSDHEKLFQISQLTLLENDSIKIQCQNLEELRLTNFGLSKAYKLDLVRASASSYPQFEAENIDLAFNSSHRVVPDWNDIEQQVVIYIDLGNNGTIDDTLLVKNQLSSTTTFQLAVVVNAGWNLVSVPGMHPFDQNVNTWWAGRDPAASVFAYNVGYTPVTTVTPGDGYWMKHLVADTLNTGDEWPAEGIQIVAHNPINAQAGWNLIGGFEQDVLVSGITTNPPGLQQGSVFGYSAGYSEATELNPGYGYWIKLSAAGNIILPTSSFNNNFSKTKTNRDSWGKIILTDADGMSYTLYALNENVNLSEYDLPPLPPSEIFDVRFGSGRFAENLNGLTHSIIMQGLDYPVTIKADAVTILLQDETGQKLNTVLNSGDQVVINDLDKVFVSGDVLPVKFALEQNYPNPFNPITTIKYSIPQNSQLTLKVYDILGSEVATLVNEEKPAGVYEVEFNATKYSSGIYFYQLQAGSFVETKKMILVK